MRNLIRRGIAVAAVATAGAGCLDYYLVGAVPHEGVPPGAVSYQVGRCVRALDRVPVQGPTETSYYVITGDSGLVLLELKNDSRAGSEIRNHWSDTESDHFFAYEKDRGGYHFVVPADRSRSGRLYTLAAGGYRVVHVEDTLRPDGNPETVCVMQPTL